MPPFTVIAGAQAFPSPIFVAMYYRSTTRRQRKNMESG